MRVAIIMGRGIEGCGVTKFTIEQTKWFEKNGYDYTVYSSKDKNWTRKNSHDVSNVVQLKLKNPEETNQMIQGCNASDVVIINSLPSSGHPAPAIEQFKRAIKEITTPIVLVQHDHSNHSIRRNEALTESIEKAKVIFAHSSDNDFARLVESQTGGGGLLDFFDDNDSKKVVNFQPGMCFDDVKSRFWKPIEEQDPLHHKWIGRTTSWKGYIQMFQLHNEYLRPNGYYTTFEGIEKSPAYLGFRELSEFHGMIDQNPADVVLEKDQPAYVFGPYINDELLERMSRCAFGYQLSLLNERFIERSIEYTHCEVASIGVVPVFRKAYGERCIHRHYGDTLINCKDNGTVWLDDNDMKSTFEILDKLSRDPVMRDEYRNMAFEFYKLHQDSCYTFDEMMNKIKGQL